MGLVGVSALDPLDRAVSKFDLEGGHGPNSTGSASWEEQGEAVDVTQSLSRPRQCWDCAVAQSFFSSLKVELITGGLGRRGRRRVGRSSSTSKCSSIAVGSTPRRGTSVRRSTKPRGSIHHKAAEAA